jgi:hypothetical protein
MNDDYEQYYYLEGRASGMLSFFASGESGCCNARLQDTDDGDQEVTSVTAPVTGD